MSTIGARKANTAIMLAIINAYWIFAVNQFKKNNKNVKYERCMNITANSCFTDKLCLNADHMLACK